ncbi:hypothetical protein SteCoe_24367 [Stentor coeruleus]|uniref:Peptidase C1A papain C-terminal domain-containing protein n=1 Tax=Stentor coeruleus TaxID=5963 RepID=A0A1R2BHS1_9CILI|nr:hypothetical protein SteCoe_24367 [Stentor coeruleus]
MGINQFTDLTLEEYASKYLNLIVSNQKYHNFPSESIEINTLPASVDWRTQGAVTPVSNEGNSCGACWAFTTAETVESAWYIAGHTLIPLSVQQLIDCSNENFGCNGGYMDLAFEYIISNGLTSAANYPYVGHDQKCNTASAKNVVAKISAYQDVKPNSLNSLMAAVAQQPVSVAVNALTWSTYSGGVLSSNCDSSSLNFAAVIVGYNTNANPKYWIVKNIWGTTWGNSGYIYIAMNDGPGVCGINEMPSYPVV